MRTIHQILKKTKFTETRMEEFWSRCYFDFLYFAEHVLGFEIADYHREWYELAEKYPRLCIEAFRGSGKTYFFSGYYLWKSIFQAPRETLIISYRESQAKQVLKIVKNMVVGNEILKQFVPENRDATWRATELELVNGAIFYCKPYNESVRMWHPDDVLCDEIGEYEDKSIYWTAVLGTIQLKRGRVIGIGTPKSAADLLSELKTNDEYYCGSYPAETNGNALWPQKYTTLDYDTDTKKSLIKIRKEMGELPYAQEYMLIPISSANSLFPMEILTPNITDQEDFLPYGRKDERYYIGYDVARTPKGDYVVMVVLGVNADRKRLVKGLRFRGTFEEQIEKLKRLYEDFKPIKIIVDATGLGDKQARDIEREFSGVEMLKVTYENKINMYTDLRREFENFNLTLPNNKDGDSYAFTQQLVKELNEIALKMDLRPGQTTRPKFHSGRHDDCLFEGTLITTNKGQKPIEEIKVGDLVLTRKGFRKVTKAWLKSENAELYQLKFNDGRTLIGTSDHKIFTQEKGFIPIDTMRNIYKPLDAISYVCQSNSMEKFTAEIKEQDIGVGQEDMDFCIEMFGNFITKKYQKDLKFTIKTETNPTTKLKTLNVSNEEDILLNTINTGQKKEKKNKENGWKKLGHSQKNGTNLKKEKNGIKHIGKKVLEIKGNQLKKDVKYVLKNLQIIRFNSQENIVQTNANKKHLELETLKKLDYTGKVYDLTVEEEHEFFANGILVHNCADALSFANRAAQNIYGAVSVRGVE